MPRLDNAPPFRFAHEVDMTETRLVPTQDDDMREINKFALKELTRDEVAIIRLDLVNDKVDRHFSRFPEKELSRISRMIVGKPLMELHATHSRMPVGTFFRSQTADTKGSKSVRPDAYIPRTFGNRDRIDNIMAGIYRGTSIGFQFDYPECSICNEDIRSCAHMPGSEYEVERSGTKKARELCHYIMHDVSDVYEGSLVPVPSQRTEVVEARTLGEFECLPLDKAIEAARSAFRAPIVIETPAKEPEAQEIIQSVEHDAGRVKNIIARARKLTSTIQ